MHRVARQADAEAIASALALLPVHIWDLIADVHFLTRSDPVFVGLHAYVIAEDGRSYGETAHVARPAHQGGLCRSRRATTVVLPTSGDMARRVIVHELGHVLHERLRFEPKAKPVTRYAKTNDGEAFAEAFAAWTLPFGFSYGAAKERLYVTDPATVGLFESLAT